MTQIRTPADAGEWEGYAAVAAQSFGRPPDETREWLHSRAVQEAIVQVAIEDGRVVGGALAFPVRQFFGGRSIPAGAVTDIAVLPERRGRGLGARLLRALERAMGEADLVVSPLWPTSLWLYRRHGWEVAGRAERHLVTTRSLTRLGGNGRVVPDPDAEELRETQRSAAAAWNGPIDRPDWWWQARESIANGTRYVYGWREGSALTGLLAYHQVPGDSRGHGIVVTELWASTGDALSGLLGFLGSHGAQAAEVEFAPSVLPLVHDLLWLSAGADVRSQSDGTWMLRLLDPRRALESRGWSTALDHRVEMEITDPLTDRPARLVLEVSRGEASVTPGGSGRVSMGAGSLAAWYAGSLPALRAARLGLTNGPADDLEAMDALTADRPTWLPDVF